MNKDNDTPINASQVIEDAKKTPFYLKITLGNLFAIVAFLVGFFLYLDEMRDTYLKKIDDLETKVSKLEGIEERITKMEDPLYLMDVLRRNNNVDFTVFNDVVNNCDSIRHYESALVFLKEQNNCR